MEGKLPNNKRKLVLAWTELHEDDLLAIWNNLQIKEDK